MSGTTVSSTASGNSQKVPMFAAKAGFVIPKNKLSGSLVPIFRGVKNPGDSDKFNGESTKQAPRKTKWGPDLTQDTAVRRGRALAYQTRVDQITQELKSGISEIADNGNLALSAQSEDRDSSRHEIDSKMLEELELEKREAIGEILKLNPSYKAPSDYKPLLKEARVSIPVKEYPGYNFVGLIFGSGGDNKKRLEKETGAKIQVYGTKVDSGQKVEIKPSDGNKLLHAYEELYVNTSADTFEKVDAAVSVIELLITSVSGNLAAASATSNSASIDDVNVPLGLDAATPDAVHSSVMQMVSGPRPIPPQGQFQYPGNWFQAGPPNNVSDSPSGLVPPPNSSALGLNTLQILSSPFRPSNMPSLFGPPPMVPVGFNSILQNPSLVSPQSQSPAPALQYPFMAQKSPGPLGPPRNSSLMASQLSSFQANNISPMGISRPLMPSLPHPVSSLPQGSLPSIPASTGFGNMTDKAPRMGSTHGLHPVVSHSVPAPAPAPVSGSFVSPTLGSAPNPSPGPPMQSGISLSGSLTNFTPVKPALLTAPSSNSFTFQPHRPQHPASQMVPRPSNQFAAQNVPPTNSILQGPASQPLPLRLPVPNLSPQPVNHGFPRPQVGNHMGQPQSHMSVAPFARNPTGVLGPSRLSTFPDASTLAARNQILQVGPRNFSPAPQIPNLPGPPPPRPGNHGNYALQTNLSFASGRSAPGEQQLYDPFSPTSLPITPQHQVGFPRR
ncbi:Polyribonucleotide nucleotidyltransferase [Parasponia andersonii]|uniref:Polyribonucleotide nucleotidyltransferase n=1 Tax=Parasponia andersonii TaxID=3476 RepID=A0A2P5CVX9_PARAD|nr:Polyribonucleotide nucleotidyltransferase [Parasponia andersonii]